VTHIALLSMRSHSHALVVARGPLSLSLSRSLARLLPLRVQQHRRASMRSNNISRRSGNSSFFGLLSVFPAILSRKEKNIYIYILYNHRRGGIKQGDVASLQVEQTIHTRLDVSEKDIERWTSRDEFCLTSNTLYDWMNNTLATDGT